MSCPNCKCKVTYPYDDSDCGMGTPDMERCSACGHIFWDELGIDDDDFEDEFENYLEHREANRDPYEA